MAHIKYVMSHLKAQSNDLTQIQLWVMTLSKVRLHRKSLSNGSRQKKNPRTWPKNVSTTNEGEVLSKVKSNRAFKNGVISFLLDDSAFLQADDCAMTQVKAGYWINCSPLTNS